MGSQFRIPVLLTIVLSLITPAHANLLVNGGFELGNVGFSSDYTYQSYLGPPGTYYINTDPNLDHPEWASFAAHGGSEMMLVNGALDSAKIVWSESALSVIPNTDYKFAAWIADVCCTAYVDPNPASLDFTINGTQIGTNFAVDSTAGLWKEFSATWNSGLSVTATIKLADLITINSGNDFALDDISFDTKVAVPEPSSTVLLGTGLVGLFLFGRRRRNAVPVSGSVSRLNRNPRAPWYSIIGSGI